MFLIIKNFVCDICHFAKQKHLPFSLNTSLASSNFELLHLDIWGPLFVSSIHGHVYFLTIVDDHSRFLWIILLKNKYEVSHHVKSFIQMVQTQFHVTPKCIRFDNGREFLIPSFYESHGILHQKSCVETPQQNGRVERKHQHILNVRRALLYQSKLPASYWSYAILHAIFFINRIPLTLLQGQSPYYILHQKLPDINTFKVFGCLCHAFSLQSHRTKLQPKARKTVFLGYKSGYKGYILLDIHSREIFVSIHVVFHEYFLPYPANYESITTQWEYFSPNPTINTEPVDVSPPPPIFNDDIYLPPSSPQHSPPNSHSPTTTAPDTTLAIHQSPRKSTRKKLPLCILMIMFVIIYMFLLILFLITCLITIYLTLILILSWLYTLELNPKHMLRQASMTTGIKPCKLNFLLLRQQVLGKLLIYQITSNK